MEKDYYGLLEVPRDVDYSGICEAYRTLALHWHPQRHEEDRYTAFRRFNEICEAFEVLSNCDIHVAERKTAYDQLGEYGLKNGVPDGHGGHTGGYSYSGNPFQIFTAFFGSSSPFAYSLDRSDYTDVMEGYVQSMMGEEMGGKLREPEHPPEVLVVWVACTLEELYNGCKKTATYTRRVMSSSGNQLTEVTQSMEVEIRKGHYEDVVRKGMGHESLEHPTGDLVLKIKEEPHERFVRKGQDLVLTVPVSLLDALLATPLEFVCVT